MAIVFDTFGTLSNTGSVISWPHTVGTNANRLLLVSLIGNINPGSVTSLKFASQALTRIAAGTNVAGALDAEFWYLINPPTGLGTFNGTFTAATGENDCVSTSYSGVNQSTPILGSVVSVGSASTPQPLSLTLTGVNSLFSGMAGYDTASAVTTNTGTPRGTALLNGQTDAADNTLGTLQWSNANTLSNWVLIGAEIQAFAPTGTLGRRTLLGVGI